MSFVHLDSQAGTLFERVGGAHFFTTLVDTFYAGVANDPVLRPLYPDDLTGPSRHLALFLMQYWGGPKTYADERGHPRLRMRHFPFAIGVPQRDAWLRHMLDAVDHSSASDKDRAALRAYFELSATSLINRPGQ
ncbi:MAG: globin [Chloroflexota bacterium]